MKYSPAFIIVHKRLAPALPIGRFASIVNPQAIGFNSQKDFYAPVRFSVQVAEGVTGAIRLDVATEKNPNWLQDMKEQLTETLGLRAVGDAVNAIDLRTITGKPLEQVPTTQLHTIGKLYVYRTDTGEPVRLPAIPNVPAEYRVTKVSDLKAWVNKLGDSIPSAVAAVLKGKDSHEVEAALRNEGEVVKTIEKELEKRQDWAEFVRLHQSNSSKSALKPEDAQKVLRKVSKQILTYVRNFVGAAREEVKKQITAEQAQKIRASSNIQKDEEHLLAPVLSGEPLSKTNMGDIKQNNKLFHTLVEDALSVPTLQKSLVGVIYNFDPSSSSSSSLKNQVIASQRPAMKRVSSSANHHPWYAHIHHTLLPIRGAYPSDYLARHTRQDMSARAPFIGDVAKTYQAYHRFVGACSAPPALKIKGGIPQERPMYLVPVGETITEKVRPMYLVPVSNELVGCHGNCKGEECDKDKDVEAFLIPIDSLLVPVGHHQKDYSSDSGSDVEAEIIEGHHSHNYKKMGHHCRHSSSSSGSDSDSDINGEIPQLVPLGSDIIGDEMPALILLGSAYGGDEMPGLVPLGSPYDTLADDDFSNLPSVSDVFK